MSDEPKDGKLLRSFLVAMPPEADANPDPDTPVYASLFERFDTPRPPISTYRDCFGVVHKLRNVTAPKLEKKPDGRQP